MTSLRAATATVLLLSLATAACSRRDARGPVVARGDGFAITAQELKSKLDEQPPTIRARYEAPEHRKDFLENMIRFRLLVAEADRRKLREDPEIQDALDRLLVQKLTRQALDDKPPQPDDADVRAYYESHASEFQQPERLRLSIISLHVKAPADRPQRAAEARKLYARLKAEGVKNPLAFSSIARDGSDDQGSRQAGGDLGFRTRQELAIAWPAQVVDAAFALKNVGDETALVESPEGFFVVKLNGRQPGVSRTLEEARPQISARLSRELRVKAYDKFVSDLRDRAAVKIDEGELAKVKLGTGIGPAASGASGPKR